jgi:hypothetical protein
VSWRRLAVGAGAVFWLFTVAIAFSLGLSSGIVWTALGLFYLGTNVAIRRTGLVHWLVVQRFGTGAAMIAVGCWRIGWDDVIIFPFAVAQLALGVLWLRVSPRPPRP